MAVIEMSFCSNPRLTYEKFVVPHTSPCAELGGQRPEGAIAKIVMRQLRAGTPGDIVPHSI
jgi:hypothetical protein